MSRWLKDNPQGHNTLHMREWLKTQAGVEYRRRHAVYMKEWRAKNRDKFHASQKRAYDKARLEVLTHYSNGTPKCACCGETELLFLQIDHIAGDGAAHRRAIGMKQGMGEQKHKVSIGGNGLPYWLKKNGFPPGFQILCANCNLAKRCNKVCPHQTNQLTSIQ